LDFLNSSTGRRRWKGRAIEGSPMEGRRLWSWTTARWMGSPRGARRGDHGRASTSPGHQRRSHGRAPSPRMELSPASASSAEGTTVCLLRGSMSPRPATQKGGGSGSRAGVDAPLMEGRGMRGGVRPPAGCGWDAGRGATAGGMRARCGAGCGRGRVEGARREMQARSATAEPCATWNCGRLQ
jgi:hypothetical protein